jgi:hypothetical protein
MKNRLRVSCTLFLFACALVGACKQQPATSRYLEIEKEAVRRGDAALRKYKTADYQTAKAALLDHLQFLDKVSSDPNISSEPNAPGEFREDAMLTCVRLSKLEEKNHGSEQAAYMKQALARCQTFKLHVVKCDEDSLRKEVDRLDEFIK